MRKPAFLAAAVAACTQGHAAATAAGSFLRGRGAKADKCTPSLQELAVDDISYAEMTTRICQVNWVFMGQSGYHWKDVDQVGCWKLKALNTNALMSSGVYQNENDGRCTLVFSGYHGKLRGAYSAITDTVKLWRNKQEMCGYTVYQPFVRLLQIHTASGNWSKIADALGGPSSTCTHVTVAAESMGGSVGEILAACANQGLLSQSGLQNASLPTFQIQKLYTFGSVAPATEPIRNPLRADGCFEGLRLYIHGDFYVGMGHHIGMSHSRVDAREIFHTRSGGVARRDYACNSTDAIGDKRHKPPPASEAISAQQRVNDMSNHEITTYMRDMRVILGLPATPVPSR
mmetsp:Transcript_71391/g.220700  ORF Transcript_71391/g.220700 Transcript_71391/m.220700 type:complete len:344 (+) Transcript_71391:89-1120(+)